MKARLSNILKLLLFCLFIFSSSNFYAQTKTMNWQNIPPWLEKTNIFAGDIPQDILLQTNTTVIAWGNIAPLPEDQGWLENKIIQEIKTLVDRNFEPGNHVVRWDGRDNSGRVVVSGVYLYRMKANDFVSVKKGLLIK
jgi:hypothetical protein